LQVKDAVALYPLFAFLAVCFAIAGAVLALPARKRVRSLGREGARAGFVLGALLAIGYALQTAGLERTTVSSTGFITGLYVVLTPLLTRFGRARPGDKICYKAA
jgi:drug/metabolite transporter (DMT)-like permease